MATHGMIDLETLSTEPDAVVMTIGAVKFDPYTNAEPHAPFYLRCDVEEQSEQLGRRIDDDTIAWWGRQSQEIQDEAFGDQHERVTIDEMTRQLNRWCVGLDYLWCQGPTFDFTILQDLYKNIQKPVAWNYWQIRDSRTLFSLMPRDPRKDIQEQLHNALADCYFQAKCVQQTFAHFNIEKG